MSDALKALKELTVDGLLHVYEEAIGSKFAGTPDRGNPDQLITDCREEIKRRLGVMSGNWTRERRTCFPAPDEAFQEETKRRIAEEAAERIAERARNAPN